MDVLHEGVRAMIHCTVHVEAGGPILAGTWLAAAAFAIFTATTEAAHHVRSGTSVTVPSDDL
jgi:hypothetical protein